jgi:two-component system KDP operon response regulator KdpE
VVSEADVHAAGPVLVVDDEPQIVRALAAILRGGGFAVATAATGEEALRAAALRPPAAILLDLGLPDADGADVCRRIREWSDAPVIVVSAADDEHGKIDALDAGADDYVTKPFSAPELLARLRAVIRRSAVPVDAEAVVPFGGAEIDLGRRLVRRDGGPVHLTAREYELLACLARHPGRVLTHATLLREVWGPAYTDETHYLRVHMANLRKKLEADAASPRHLLTESGVGYKLEPGR